VLTALDDRGREALARNRAIIDRLARIDGLAEGAAPKGSVTIPVPGGAFALPLQGVIDFASEKARLSKTLEKLDKDIGGLKGRLGNPKFVASAPEEVVEAVGDRLLLNFELVNDSPRLDGVETLAVALFRRFNLFDRAMISSFNPRVLWAVRRQEPRITLGALWGSFSPWYLRADWWRRRARVEALHPEYTLVTPAFVARAHAQGRRVHTWTVNDAETAARLRAMGVDMIMGDYPDRLMGHRQPPPGRPG
ncbi:MAG: glycerophosphodiester phosphodiesterase family protein, partial [Caldilineales bacterium]|nr:glycerophosphodiester phosphodiesterase family protein [Caldilineales bacterium]